MHRVDNWRSWLSSQQCPPRSRQHLSRVNLRQQHRLLEDRRLRLLHQQHKHSVAAGQLSLLPSAGREMSSSLRATGWRPSVAEWRGGMSASCKPQVQLFADAGNGWPHSVLRYHYLMPISCHFRDCKALLVTCSCKKRCSKYREFATFTFTFRSVSYAAVIALHPASCSLNTFSWKPVL